MLVNFFEPSRSSSSRRCNFHLLRAIALIFIAPSRFSSSYSHRAQLHFAFAIFIFFEPLRSSSSRCRARQLLQAFALIFIALSRLSSSLCRYDLHLLRAIALIFIASS
jgi:hypothetical protein